MRENVFAHMHACVQVRAYPRMSGYILPRSQKLDTTTVLRYAQEREKNGHDMLGDEHERKD